jgi:hypothetical protein
MNQLKQISNMKKIFILLPTIFLLNGCAESLALLGTGTSNGKIFQSSLNSAISYGVKKQTGKTPLEHALAYAEEKNPEKKQETCISFIERTRSEFCTILNKQISLTNIAIKEKTLEIVKKYPKNNKTSENIVLEEENFMSSFLPKTSPRKLAIAVQAKMKEKSKNKDLN